MGGPEDVQRVDLGRRGQAQAHAGGLAQEGGGELPAAGGDQALWSRRRRRPRRAGAGEPASGRMTAAATTGPNSEPRPTSSTPATSRAPPRRAPFEPESGHGYLDASQAEAAAYARRQGEAVLGVLRTLATKQMRPDRLARG
ncbi:MAG: hypothetical protein MZV64_13120 [Ignavibacteriales bacterium]|nr:hypothetical protein [Ignavibacteriales bacterium]